MKKYNILFWLLSSLIFVSSCSNDTLSPVEKDEIAPEPVANVQVERLPGAAKLTYTLPSDADLLYVKAEYTNKSGRSIQVKVSYYTNSLTIEGFSDTTNYDVRVCAVDRSENESEPIMINVKPLTPPFETTSQEIQVNRDFGGIQVHTLNLAKANLAIIICTKDSFGNYVTDKTYYTSQDTIQFSQRGYPSELTTFALYVRDRWNNCSDTIFSDIIPIYEKKLDKTKFKALSLPSDAPVGWGLDMTGMWDDLVARDGSMFHTQEIGFPMWFTFDLGVNAKLSRFTLWQRSGDYLFGHGNPKLYEVWGSNSPNPNGSWDNTWTKLVNCVSVKPSGLALGKLSSEDISYAAAGEEFIFPLEAPKVRYIRFRVLSNWSGGAATHISEMSFWGNDNADEN